MIYRLLFRASHKRASLRALVLMMLLPIGKIAYASDLEISYFGLLEKSSQRLIIEGVGMNYTFGVLGVNLTTQIASDTSLTTRIGAGYTPNHQVSFAGATFTGPFIGYYVGASTSTPIFQLTGQTDLYIDTDLSYRNFFSKDLVGVKGSSTFTGTSDGVMSVVGLNAVARHRLTSLSYVYASYGVSKWELKAIGDGVSNSGLLTARKRINAAGTDPRWSIGYRWQEADSSLELAMAHQSLESATENNIISVQAVAKFAF